jgi:hypothetical protein
LISNTFKEIMKWNTEESRRKFFVSYAKTHHFDPYKPDNWYSQSKVEIMSHKVQRERREIRGIRGEGSESTN